MKIVLGNNVVKLALISTIGSILVSSINAVSKHFSKKKYCDKLRAGMMMCDEYIEANKDTLTEEDIKEIRDAQSELMIKLFQYA